LNDIIQNVYENILVEKKFDPQTKQEQYYPKIIDFFLVKKKNK
jgi:hypothetical protein